MTLVAGNLLFAHRLPLARVVLGARAMSTFTPLNEREVYYERDARVRTVVLNRPKQLNALNLSMVRDMTPHYISWQRAADVAAIVMVGAGEKAFCAGGDVRALYDGLRSGQSIHQVTQFFREEYHLNNLIGNSKKPQISILNGIVMGGGVGLSVHGQFRVATDNSLFAMPETAIGLFPDVGGSHCLSRLRGGLGTFLALTGNRLKAQELLEAGIATHYVPIRRLEALRTHLRQLETSDATVISNTISDFAGVPVDTPLKSNLAAIEKHFDAKNSVEEIIESLKSDDSRFAQDQLKLLGRMSPLSMKVTFRQLKEGATRNLTDCLKMEYRMAVHMMESSDFLEGVRAVLVDKDNTPVWRHKTLEEVTAAEVERTFMPLDEKEEWNPLRID